ncbi:MAG: hypothetical protein M1835_004191, partial [Candelina submexicana]
MDDETLSKIIELQLEDVEERLGESKGKHVAGTTSDADIALQIYRDELSNQEVIASDRRMVRSIRHAIQTDRETITQAKSIESNAFRDRELACRLGGVEAPSKTQLEPFLDSTTNDKEESASPLEPFSAWDPSQLEDVAESEDKEGSTSKKGKGGHKTSKSQQCVACRESKHVFDIIEAPCHDLYCRECIGDLFETATTDESLFPPRCCRQNIPLDLVKGFLSKALIERIERVTVEYGTPNRTYCVWPTCSAFIPPDRINGDIAVCPDSVTAVPSSATSAAYDGRPANVPSGTLNDCNTEQNKSWLGIFDQVQYCSRSGYKLRQICFENVMSAIMDGGDSFKDRIS